MRFFLNEFSIPSSFPQYSMRETIRFSISMWDIYACFFFSPLFSTHKSNVTSINVYFMSNVAPWISPIYIFFSSSFLFLFGFFSFQRLSSILFDSSACLLIYSRLFKISPMSMRVDLAIWKDFLLMDKWLSNTPDEGRREWIICLSKWSSITTSCKVIRRRS